MLKGFSLPPPIISSSCSNIYSKKNNLKYLPIPQMELANRTTATNAFGCLLFLCLLSIGHQNNEIKNEVPKSSQKCDDERTGKCAIANVLQMAKELLSDSAPLITPFSELTGTANGSDWPANWAQTFAVRILCSEQFDAYEQTDNKLRAQPNDSMESFKKLRINFCGQLEQGKSIEEAAQNAQMMAQKLAQHFPMDIPSDIAHRIRANIEKQPNVRADHGEKVAKLVHLFTLNVGKIFAQFKACPAISAAPATVPLLQKRRRRRKRMEAFETAVSDTVASFRRGVDQTGSGPVTTRYSFKSCVGLFVTCVCSAAAAVVLGLQLGNVDSKVLILIMLILCIFAFLIFGFLFVWHCPIFD